MRRKSARSSTKAKKADPARQDTDSARFNAEMAYGYSAFCYAMGDVEGSIEAANQALEFLPTFAPAMLTVGVDEYLHGDRAKGLSMLMALVDLPDSEPGLVEILDQAGDVLIGARAYQDGLALYRAAAIRFPDVAVLHQGLGCCAGHVGLHEEAIAASRRALELEPDNQKFVNDLGYTLVEAGKLEEAEELLLRAVAMDPKDGLAAANLDYCREKPEKAKLSRRARRSKN